MTAGCVVIKCWMEVWKNVTCQPKTNQSPVSARDNIIPNIKKWFGSHEKHIMPRLSPQTGWTYDLIIFPKRPLLLSNVKRSHSLGLLWRLHINEKLLFPVNSIMSFLQLGPTLFAAPTEASKTTRLTTTQVEFNFVHACLRLSKKVARICFPN